MGHLSQALEIDKISWKALQGQSKCLVQQEKYDEAAQTLSDALKLVPESMKYVIPDLRNDLTEIVLAKGDFKIALKHAQDLYSSDPTDCEAVCGYVKALYALRDHDSIVKTVEDLREIELSSENWTDIRFLGLRDVHFELGCALRIKGKLELVRPWVDACFSLFPKVFNTSPWLSAWIAEFTYSFYNDPDESLRMCEYILSSEFKSALGPELIWAYDYPSSSAARQLCNIYFQKALSAHKAGKDTEPWIPKLKELATSKAGRSDEGPVYRMNDASLLLGIYLRRYGGADEKTWKHCSRAMILETIDLLGHEDRTYDQNSYNQLAKVLMAAGQKSIALEALAVVLRPLEAISNPELLKAFKAIDFITYYYGCDGPCRTQFHTYKDPPYKELYFCEDCIDTCFCEDCFPIAKKGELPFRKCSPEHSFVQVFPIPVQVKDVAARFIDMKTVEVQKDWLDALRKEWL
jgi:tetratricopeptide (TPR) repeat protein